MRHLSKLRLLLYEFCSSAHGLAVTLEARLCLFDVAILVEFFPRSFDEPLKVRDRYRNVSTSLVLTASEIDWPDEGHSPFKPCVTAN